jgi:hypothetical protein
MMLDEAACASTAHRAGKITDNTATVATTFDFTATSQAEAI